MPSVQSGGCSIRISTVESMLVKLDGNAQSTIPVRVLKELVDTVTWTPSPTAGVPSLLQVMLVGLCPTRSIRLHTSEARAALPPAGSLTAVIRAASRAPCFTSRFVENPRKLHDAEEQYEQEGRDQRELDEVCTCVPLSLVQHPLHAVPQLDPRPGGGSTRLCGTPLLSADAIEKCSENVADSVTTPGGE